MATFTSWQDCSEAWFLCEITVKFLQISRKCQFQSRNKVHFWKPHLIYYWCINMMHFSHTSWIHFSFASALQKWGSTSTCQVAAQSIHALLHYTTKFPLVTMGCPTFTPKIAHSCGAVSILSSCLILLPSWPTIQTASRCNQPFCHNPLDRHKQTDTHRLTDGPGDKTCML